MKKYELDKKDYNQIENLIRIGSSIETLYKKMCNLEIEEKKDTDEYKKILDYLKIALEVESKQYANII